MRRMITLSLLLAVSPIFPANWLLFFSTLLLIIKYHVCHRREKEREKEKRERERHANQEKEIQDMFNSPRGGPPIIYGDGGRETKAKEGETEERETETKNPVQPVTVKKPHDKHHNTGTIQYSEIVTETETGREKKSVSVRNIWPRKTRARKARGKRRELKKKNIRKNNRKR